MRISDWSSDVCSSDLGPPTVTGMLTVDALLAGDGRALRDALSHLVLPALVLGWAVMGIISRLVRASMLDVLGQEYITTARAKGASQERVLQHQRSEERRVGKECVSTGRSVLSEFH